MRPTATMLALQTLIFACNSSPVQSPAKSPSARAESPEFAVVDKFQLWAACAATKVPQLSEHTVFNYSRLRLADGTIKPWLIVEAVIFPEAQGDRTLEQWQKKLNESRSAHNNCQNCQGPSVNPRAISYTYMSDPCEHQALQYTVVTAVFTLVTEKTRSSEIVVMVGEQMERISGPVGNDGIRKAFELTTKVLGQSATVDVHRIPIEDSETSTAPLKWRTAAAAPSPADPTPRSLSPR